MLYLELKTVVNYILQNAEPCKTIAIYILPNNELTHLFDPSELYAGHLYSYHYLHKHRFDYRFIAFDIRQSVKISQDWHIKIKCDGLNFSKAAQIATSFINANGGFAAFKGKRFIVCHAKKRYAIHIYEKTKLLTVIEWHVKDPLSPK